jgi:hypothetical protein
MLQATPAASDVTEIPVLRSKIEYRTCSDHIGNFTKCDIAVLMFSNSRCKIIAGSNVVLQKPRQLLFNEACALCVNASAALPGLMLRANVRKAIHNPVCQL